VGLIKSIWAAGSMQAYEQVFGTGDVTTDAMRKAITDWRALYFGEAPDGEDPCQRLPVAIVAKLTRTMFSEYGAAVVDTAGAKADFLSGVVSGFSGIRQKAMQIAMIGGLCLVKPIIEDDGTVLFLPIPRENVIVLGRDSWGTITDLALQEVTKRDRYTYTLLERRTVDRDGWLRIENRLFRRPTGEEYAGLGLEVPLRALDRYDELEPVIEYNRPIGSTGMIPIRLPLENIVDGSADGVSVYASAAGLIHNINRNEAQINGEFERGQSRIIVADGISKTRPDGSRGIVDNVFTAIDGDPDEIGLHIFSPALREASFLARKNEYLRNIESVIGIKRGILSEVEAAERTATEITSSEGDYNLTILDLQGVWDGALREAVRVSDLLAQEYGVAGSEPVDASADVQINWGDGVLYNRDKVWGELTGMVAAGLLAPEVAVGWYFDMPTNTPEERQAVREKYMPEIDALAGDA